MRLKRHATLSQRTVITLQGPIQLVHCGYRCPNSQCITSARVYRSAAADAVALPGFTFGLDVVILIGYLKLSQHQTLDEVHDKLLKALAVFNLTISRREVLYLFEAYCQLLRASQQPSDDPHFQAWLAQVRTNGGLIISIDGIQPDKGNETIYLVRDVLTGRILNAENVTSSDAQTLKQILSPVLKLPVPVVGVISDAQISEIKAIGELWPDIPHQTCQFHYLREAGRPIFDLDRGSRVELRKDIQKKLRNTTLAWNRQNQQKVQQQKAVAVGEESDQIQLEILKDYAASIQNALNIEGSLPFDYPGLKTYERLEEIEGSLQRVAKKGLISASAQVFFKN